MPINIEISGSFMRADEFDEGKMVKVLKYEYVPASNPKYGDDNGNTHRFTLVKDNGEEVLFDTTSKRLLRAINEAQVEEGDVIYIKAQGEGYERTYTVTKPTEEEMADVPF